MRIIFYKLPGAAGENVLVTENYAFVDSEIAVLLDEADLDLTYYDIRCDNGELSVWATEEGTTSDDAAPFITISVEGDIEGALPFRDEEKAYQFLEDAVKWQEHLNNAYDLAEANDA